MSIIMIICNQQLTGEERGGSRGGGVGGGRVEVMTVINDYDDIYNIKLSRDQHMVLGELIRYLIIMLF